MTAQPPGWQPPQPGGQQPQQPAQAGQDLPAGQWANGQQPQPDSPQLREKLLRLAVRQLVEYGPESGPEAPAEAVSGHLLLSGWPRDAARQLAAQVAALPWEQRLEHYRAWRQERSGLPSRDQRRQARLQALEDDKWAREQQRARDRQPVVLLTAAEVWDSPDLDWLVPPLIPRTGIGTIFGATGTWKSFLALHLQLCIRTGASFLGCPVARRGWCFYLLGEGQAGARRRLRAGVAGLPAAGGPPDGLGYCMVPFPLADQGAAGDFIARARQQAGDGPVALVVLDAAADFYGADANENSATDMNPLIASAKLISRELGCFVLLVAHSGYEGGHVRGTSRFGQAWDFEAESAPDALPGCGWLRVTKVKEDEAGTAIPFHVVKLAPERARPDVTSLAVRWQHPAGAAEQAAAAETAEDEQLNGTELRVWRDIIGYLHAHAGKDRPLSFNRVKAGVKGNEATKRQMLDHLVRNGLAEEADRSGYFLPTDEPPYRMRSESGPSFEWRPWEPEDRQWAVIAEDGTETVSDGR